LLNEYFDSSHAEQGRAAFNVTLNRNISLGDAIALTTIATAAERTAHSLGRDKAAGAEEILMLSARFRRATITIPRIADDRAFGAYDAAAKGSENRRRTPVKVGAAVEQSVRVRSQDQSNRHCALV
jgi:hypothetical protein